MKPAADCAIRGRSTLEVDSRVDHESTRSGRCGDAAERVISRVDVHNRVAEVWVIQDVDSIQTELEVRRFAVQLETFDQVHVETETIGTFERRESERSDFFRLWV